MKKYRYLKEGDILQPCDEIYLSRIWMEIGEHVVGVSYVGGYLKIKVRRRINKKKEQLDRRKEI